MQSPQQFWGSPHMASCGQACSPHLECGHAVHSYTAGLQWAPLETLLSVDGPQSAHSMGSQSGMDPTFHCGSSLTHWHTCITDSNDRCVCDELCRHVPHVLCCLLFLPQTCGNIPVTKCSGGSPASDSEAPGMRYNQAPHQFIHLWILPEQVFVLC